MPKRIVLFLKVREAVYRTFGFLLQKGIQNWFSVKKTIVSSHKLHVAEKKM